MIQMVIKLQKSILRPWRVGDEDSLVENANNRNVWRNLRDIFPHPYTRKDADNWIALAGSQDPVINFAIEVAGLAVGGVGLKLREDVDRRSAEIGYWLGECYWRRGIVSEALAAVTEYAFASFDICRLEAGVFDWNPASAHLLEKVGYVLEGRLRSAITKDGQTIDELVYAMVRE